MEIRLTDHAWDDLEYWKQTNNVRILKKIDQLIASIETTPFKGIGKPEPLKHQYKGYWSRRITDEHRLVYKVEKNIITVYSLRFHYS